MRDSLYLINPRSDCPTYYGAEVAGELGFGGMVLVADLATTTVAAMAPPEFRVRICEESVTPVDLEAPEEFIGLTGKTGQIGRMLELAREFRRRGKTVLIGGPYASLSPEAVRPHCDILVRGEMEGIAARLFEDLARGSWQAEYVGGVPDLATSPVPRWDLYPNDWAAMGCVQTARGCPFECEFCDVIQYVGRKQRHKAVEQVLCELDRLYDLGYRSVFLADDNFTVYRKRARELLTALRDWNATRREGPMALLTQLSIDVARDEDILELCAQAGLTDVFIGIETPNEGSLKETKKRQNLGRDLAAAIHTFVRHGIAVTGGMIVGFDHDGSDIFERQYEFAMSLPIPVFTLGSLVAPSATPLFERLRREGRLVDTGPMGATTLPWQTNILPAQMTPEELSSGTRRLANRLYQPEAFEQRVLQMIEAMPERIPAAEGKRRSASRHPATLRSLSVIRAVRRLGPREALMYSRLMSAAERKPAARPGVMISLFRYMQIRHIYRWGGYWEDDPPAPRRAAS